MFIIMANVVFTVT